MPTFTEGDYPGHAAERALYREWQVELRRRGLSSERRICEIARIKVIYGIRVPAVVTK